MRTNATAWAKVAANGELMACAGYRVLRAIELVPIGAKVKAVIIAAAKMAASRLDRIIAMFSLKPGGKTL